jgi:ABC-type sugar transport system substrate-binding protein
MGKWILVVAVSLLLAAPARAEWCAGWDSADTGMASVFAAALTSDIVTTRRALDKDKREGNPWMSEHPSDAELLLATSVGLAAYLTGACVLPKPQREWWGALWIGVEAHAAYRNALVIGLIGRF